MANAVGFCMKNSPFFAIAASLCALLTTACHAEQKPVSFEKKIEETLKLDFLLSLPKGYEKNDTKKWPLVVFLHGAGERGADLELLKKHGPPKLVDAGKHFPFILASPQCPADEWWTEQPVLELIDHLEEAYQVDSSRIYLTGLSMGGYGTWHFSTMAPDRFAAIAPICGGGVPYKMRWITHLPVWAFHGGKDTVVVPDESERLIAELKKRSNGNAKLTVYPEAGHDSWTQAYDTEGLYEWLLTHSLPQKP